MKTHNIKTLTLGIASVSLLLLMAFQTKSDLGMEDPMALAGYSEKLQAEAFEILKTKCNACHKRQNPFMIFSMKNMNRRAEKINKMVFETKRMPKGDEYILTPREYEILQNWILTQTNQ